MADNSTIARPYAKAVFELAQSESKLDQWNRLLRSIAAAVDNPRVVSLLHDPHVGSAKIGQIIVDVLGDRLDLTGRNFVRLLAENRRLDVLPEIAERYEALRAEAERTVDVNVTSAVSMTDEHKAQLTASLQRRLGREVRLHCDVDESLLGGAVVRAGDLVIDSSLRGSLQKLATTLNH